MEENRITVSEYLNNKDLLEISYTPYAQKMDIISHSITELTKAIGGLNTALLNRTVNQLIIESSTNLDLKGTDENGLDGYDQLIFNNEYDNLTKAIGFEYNEFRKILDYYVEDYIRIETNPAMTISRIYQQLIELVTTALEGLEKYIEGLDSEQLNDFIKNVLPKSEDESESDN